MQISLVDRLWADLQAISSAPHPEELHQMVESWSLSLRRTPRSSSSTQGIGEHSPIAHPCCDDLGPVISDPSDAAPASDAPAIPDTDS